MFQGQYLFKNGWVYSPWMARGGDNMVVTAEKIAFNTSDLEVEVYTKPSDETGDDGTKVGSTLSLSHWLRRK